jgi:hypothetical protein
MDFPEVVDQGLNQMIQSVNDPEAILDVRLLPDRFLSLYLSEIDISFILSLSHAVIIIFQVYLVGSFDDSPNRV